MLEDGQKALDYLNKDKGIGNSRVILYGESLGTAVAMDIAHKHKDSKEPLAGLMLNCPFTNKKQAVTDCVAHYAGKTLGKLVAAGVSKELDTETKAKDISIPTIIFSAKQDKIVPPAQHNAVFSNLGGDKKQHKILSFDGEHIVSGGMFQPALEISIDNAMKNTPPRNLVPSPSQTQNLASPQIENERRTVAGRGLRENISNNPDKYPPDKVQEVRDSLRDSKQALENAGSSTTHETKSSPKVSDAAISKEKQEQQQQREKE